MVNQDVDVDQDTLEEIRARVLQEEDNQLHFKRPPSIIQDLKAIIEEEITDVEIDEDSI